MSFAHVGPWLPEPFYRAQVHATGDFRVAVGRAKLNGMQADETDRTARQLAELRTEHRDLDVA
ncbi:MAG: hypothetical protein L0H70_01760, partial [Xanthomonadales bacterium]|nr:hypothetical protein [Xanthomonadales bacterium]